MSHHTPNKLPEGVTPKYLPDGKENPKYVDLLEEDKPIAGQKFVWLSFVSPEHIIKQKEHFLFEEFIKQWDFKKSMEKFTQFLNFVSFKYSISFDKLTADFQDFNKEEGATLAKASTISDDYKTFIDNNEEELDQQFGEKHQFQTSVRGIKVRGVFATQGEAELRCVRPFLAEKAIIALDDVNDIKNWANYHKLKGFAELLWEDLSVRNGAAIFQTIAG